MRRATLFLTVPLLLCCAAARDASAAPRQEVVKDAEPAQVTNAPVAGARPEASSARKNTVAVKLPAGVRVEVEAAHRVSSQEIRKGDLLTFRVVNPVKVDGVTVIEAGAAATARVVKASRGGHFGRAGRLAWTMYEVTAVDGTRVAIESDGRRVGDSKGAKVAAKIVATGFVLGLAAPAALFHGFKRGENAYLPEGFRFEAVTSADAQVFVAAPPRQ